MEGSELFRHAEKWLTDNPGKTLRDYYKATGYTGPKLKPRQRKGQPISISYKGKSAESEGRRRRALQSKTPEEAANLYQTKKLAQKISQDPIHQLAYEGKPSIAEHDVRVLSGGSNEYMSISDPDFKVFKDTIEQKVHRQFPDGQYVVDVDDVSGGVRIIDSNYHNKFEPTSQQPGFTLEPGEDIDAGLQKNFSKPTLSSNRGSIGFKRSALTGLAATGIAALGPLGTAVSAAETAGRKEIADITGNPVDRVQQYISGASLAADAASYAPPLTVPATIVSTGLDAINVGIDTTRGFINLFTRR